MLIPLSGESVLDFFCCCDPLNNEKVVFWHESDLLLPQGALGLHGSNLVHPAGEEGETPSGLHAGSSMCKIPTAYQHWDSPTY